MKELVFQMIVRQIAAKASSAAAATSRLGGCGHAPHDVVDDAVLGVEEPGEDQAGKRQRQRPRQQQGQTHWPFALERQIGQHGQAEADHQRAGTVISVISTVFLAAFQKSGSLNTST